MYIEQLGKVDLRAMYRITTQERLLQNLVNEYEKFADPRLVPPQSNPLKTAKED